MPSNVTTPVEYDDARVLEARRCAIALWVGTMDAGEVARVDAIVTQVLADRERTAPARIEFDMVDEGGDR